MLTGPLMVFCTSLCPPRKATSMLKGSVAVSWKMATLDLAAAVLGSWYATPPLQQIEKSACEKEKKIKDCACWRQCNEKPSIIPSCPGKSACVHVKISGSAINEVMNCMFDPHCWMSGSCCGLLSLFWADANVYTVLTCWKWPGAPHAGNDTQVIIGPMSLSHAHITQGQRLHVAKALHLP